MINQMNDETSGNDKSKNLSLQRSIAIFIGGALFFTLPYGFVWFLVKGGSFETGFVVYVKIAAVASLLIGTVSSLVAALIKFLRVPLKKKPALPDSYAIVAMVIAFGTSIGAGIADGVQTGILAFWPAAFFSMCAIHSAHWILYQFQTKNVSQ